MEDNGSWCNSGSGSMVSCCEARCRCGSERFVFESECSVGEVGGGGGGGDAAIGVVLKAVAMAACGEVAVDRGCATDGEDRLRAAAAVGPLNDGFGVDEFEVGVEVLLKCSDGLENEVVAAAAAGGWVALGIERYARL